ncbi:MAG: hypothetical protein Kow00121_57950 [Elainellaceae cyanobacterium]
MANTIQLAQLMRPLWQYFNLSPEKFAARLCISARTVNRWENDHTKPSPIALDIIDTVLKEVNKEINVSASRSASPAISAPT